MGFQTPFLRHYQPQSWCCLDTSELWFYTDGHRKARDNCHFKGQYSWSQRWNTATTVQAEVASWKKLFLVLIALFDTLGPLKIYFFKESTFKGPLKIYFFKESPSKGPLKIFFQKSTSIGPFRKYFLKKYIYKIFS